MLIICLYGPKGRGEAAERSHAASGSSDVKVVLLRRVELMQDGAIQSNVQDRPHNIQVSEHECDAELDRQATGCVFLIYEMQ